jgi:hypothetical protein
MSGNHGNHGNHSNHGNLVASSNSSNFSNFTIFSFYRQLFIHYMLVSQYYSQHPRMVESTLIPQIRGALISMYDVKDEDTEFEYAHLYAMYDALISQFQIQQGVYLRATGNTELYPLYHGYAPVSAEVPQTRLFEHRRSNAVRCKLPLRPNLREYHTWNLPEADVDLASVDEVGAIFDEFDIIEDDSDTIEDDSDIIEDGFDRGN